MRKIASFLLSGATYFAFAQGPSPSPVPSAAPSAAPPSPISKSASNLSAELQSYLEPFIYDMKDRKDPFRPYSEAANRGNGDGEFEGPMLPLQRFELDDFQLIGIIWDVKEPKAMFMDPSSQIHVLSRDDRIGRNNGFIAAIREGEVVVVETVVARGETIRSARVLKISR